jgi:phenylpropionate dioxygenase-like ring-hydroxylating dioxygenase large terminal subunit
LREKTVGASIDALLGSRPLSAASAPLEKAHTLPAEAYTSSEIYRLEVERIFERDWLCAGRVDQVPEAGDYLALDLLGDKLMIVRDAEDRVRVLSRVCRHRAAELVQGAGNTRSFQCPYHAWNYRLDGALIGAPHMDGVDGFDRKDCRLPEVRNEIWEGWIFVNFDGEADALAPRLTPLAKLLENYRMSDMVAVETATFDSPFNWKILVDNFMEAYHHIAIHRDTFEPVFPAALSGSPDNEGPYSLLYMPTKTSSEGDLESLPGALPHHGDLSVEERNRLVAGVIFPFHLFAPTAESLTWYHIIPHEVDRFTLRIYTCFPQATLAEPAHKAAVEGIQEFIRIVHNQDIAACEAVWAGLGAKSFSSGRLSILEKSIWQFNQWWLERLRST